MKKFYGFALLAGLAIAGAAVAQGAFGPPYGNTVSAPVVSGISPTDLVQIIPRGFPTTGDVYTNPGAIAGVPLYAYNVPVTAFSLTFANNQAWFILNPAGTLATGTITMAPNPSDGQRECVSDSQIQTAITFTANAGQTVVGAPTAEASANWVACFSYVASVATWFKA